MQISQRSTVRAPLEQIASAARLAAARAWDTDALYIETAVHTTGPEIIGLARIAGVVLWVFEVHRFVRFVSITRHR
ncbi:hypothetical protein [Actinomadura sp. KC06]|uniref:hypothetical protein n=1 Tax=Actinomadura sp. KC06 TaxID=2530369 RepID=UPI001048C73F|nr:hypothetical protein [Actinomadura sp. KC06]